MVDHIGRQAAIKRIDGFLWSGDHRARYDGQSRLLEYRRAKRSLPTLINAADLAVADGMPLVWLSACAVSH